MTAKTPEATVRPSSPYEWLQELAAALGRRNVSVGLHNTPEGPFLRATLISGEVRLSEEIRCHLRPDNVPEFSWPWGTIRESPNVEAVAARVAVVISPEQRRAEVLADRCPVTGKGMD